MKNLSYILNFGLILLVSISFSCEKKLVLNYGNDAEISGMILDTLGNPISGDVASESLTVSLLSEGDTKPIVIRVLGDGTYQNSRLFRVPYQVWFSGSVFMETPADTVVIDFTKDKKVKLNWIGTPYLTIDLPEIDGEATPTLVNIKYKITGNNGKKAATRELYCSTNPYPYTSTGSGVGYQTVKVKLKNDGGSAAVKGLTPGTKYYVRIAAKPSDSPFLFSNQIIFTTPSE